MTLSTDIYLGYTIFLLSSSFQLVAIPLSIQIGPSLSSHLPPTSVTTGSSFTYQCSLTSDWDSNLRNIFTASSIGPRLITKNRTSLGSNMEEGLLILSKHVERLRDQIAHLTEVQENLCKQVELQNVEFHRQVNCVEQIRQSIQTSSRLNLVEKVEKCRSMQKDMTARADNILQILLDNWRPDLSPAEEAWIQELGTWEYKIRRWAGDTEKV